MSSINFSPLVESIYSRTAKGKPNAMLMKIGSDGKVEICYGNTVAPVADIFICLETPSKSICIPSCESKVSCNLMLLFDLKDDEVRLAVMEDVNEILSTDDSPVVGHIFAAAMTRSGQEFFVDVALAKGNDGILFGSLVTDAAPELIRHFACIAELSRKNSKIKEGVNYYEE